MARTKQLYEDSGVELSKATINVGDEVTLLYRGLLAKSGADSVYAHIGYGDSWEAKEYIPMEKVEDVFKATIKVNLSDKLNIAFKDGVDNWDNNSQQNYSFNVSAKSSKTSGASKTASATTEKKTSPKVKASVSKSEAAKEGSATKTKTAKAKATPSTKSTTKSATKKTTTDKTTTAKKSTAAKKNSK